MPETSRRPRSVLVVGAGLAGARTVAALRAEGFTGRVSVLGAEGLPPYDRPPLSKHLLDRPEPVWLADDLGLDLADLADEVRLDEPARTLSLDGDGATVHTDRRTLRAEALVVASGSHAVRPWPAALSLHTAADAAALRDRLRPGARLVVVGAGWIGAEVAGVAARTGVQVTVVEAAHPLAGALGDLGRLTAPWYPAAGVRLLTGVRVAAVRQDGVALADGTALPADAVLAAVGARPATGWLGDALAADADGHVRVDERWAPLDGPVHVRVVGDAARRRSARHGWVPGGHWDTALRGPETAVRGLLGVPGPAEDLAPYVFSTQLGHELALFGIPDGDDVVLRGDPTGTDGWSAVWFAADRAVAVLVVDRPRDGAAARRLFTGATLPRVDRVAVTDLARPLRAVDE